MTLAPLSRSKANYKCYSFSKKNKTFLEPVGCYCSNLYGYIIMTFIGVGSFRILGGPRLRILGGGGQIPSRHMTSE